MNPNPPSKAPSFVQFLADRVAALDLHLLSLRLVGIVAVSVPAPYLTPSSVGKVAASDYPQPLVLQTVDKVVVEG